MTEGKLIDVFGRELEQYFDFYESFDKISAGIKADGCSRSVYLTNIKKEYMNFYSNGSVIIKELSQTQADNYRKLSSVWNPYLEMIYGVLERDGNYISVQEFVEAPECLECGNRSLNLEEYISEFGCLTERDALIFLWQLCEGVKTLEKLHLTHGDIAPGNILLTNAHEWDSLFQPLPAGSSRMSVKLIDFDISKQQKGSGHRVTTVLGTKSFAAPEILDYRFPSDRVDIYGLGCVLYYMLTGESPKESDGGGKKISRGVLHIIEGCTAGYTMRYPFAARLQKDILRQLRMNGWKKSPVLSYIPGFRSRRYWKMAVSCGVYLYLFLCFFIAAVTDRQNLFLSLFFLICCFGEIMLVFDVFHLGRLSKKYMEYRAAFPPLKYIVKFLVGFSLFIFMLICAGLGMGL